VIDYCVLFTLRERSYCQGLTDGVILQTVFFINLYRLLSDFGYSFTMWLLVLVSVC